MGLIREALRCPSGLILGAHGSICVLLPLLEPPHERQPQPRDVDGETGWRC